jgi:lactoylglutathione lyase
MNSPVLKNIDCIRLYVSNLEDGLKYYSSHLGLKLIWKTQKAIGLGMTEGITEIVIQTEDKTREIDFKVDNVDEAIKEISKAGGKVVVKPFDIPIGRCAVIEDPWENRYVILDSTKGTFITDGNGNIVGQKK